MTNREHEQTLNVWLADELRRRGLNAKEEVQHSQGRIDVEIRVGSVAIAVEAKHGQDATKKSDAIKDADARLKQNLAECAIALCYPDHTTRESLPDTELMWAVLDASTAEPSWTTGNLEQLVLVIRLAPMQLGDPDAVAAALSNSLDEAVRKLGESQRQNLAQTLDLPPSKIGKGKQTSNNRWNQAAKRALLVVATAVMFHSRLDSHLHDLRPENDNRQFPPQPFLGDWPPIMAQQCIINPDPVQAFTDAWNLILALDYKPIFETGIAALQSCSQDAAFANAIKETATAALAVSRNIAGLRHDLLGRIFHTVLDTARYDGSFYTTTAAATLLATLAIRENMCNWQDQTEITNLRITDPACGTGTLLMAAAERIHDLAPQSRDDGPLAQGLIEKVFSGYDVNLTATHMAATTLGLLSPTTRFKNMRIGRALLGVDEAGTAFLGSLEFLDRQPKLLSWPNAAQAVSQIDTGEEMVQADPADLVIMNPPFTRDSLRHDQFTPSEEKKIKDREKRLFSKKPTYMAGNSGAFLFLAEYMSKSDSGAIATVLPLPGATDKSGSEIRRYLASRFHIQIIVTSHDPDRIYFSENTNIGEILLVCRRWPEGKEQKPPTQVINLAKNPSTPSESMQVAWAIENNSVQSLGYGTVQEWPESRIATGDWGAVQFLAPYLCAKFASLKDNEVFPSTALGKISVIGPEGRRTRDAFARSTMPDEQGRTALWLHDTEVTQSMAAKADTHIIAEPEKTHLAESYWEQRSKLLLPTRLFLPTSRVVAVRLNNAGLGSAWVPCRPEASWKDSETLEKSICLYLNSSMGILSVLGERTNRKPTYPRFSIDDMRKLRVPDFKTIGQATMEKLARAYDTHAQEKLLPLPQMNICPVRQSLDNAISDALELDEEIVSAIRRNISNEPSVTGHRYTGL